MRQALARAASPGLCMCHMRALYAADESVHIGGAERRLRLWSRWRVYEASRREPIVVRRLPRRGSREPVVQNQSDGCTEAARMSERVMVVTGSKENQGLAGGEPLVAI
jgi:hypothetical protein